MAAIRSKIPPEHEPGGGAELERRMIMTTPNPRRTPPRDTNHAQDGRKRQKLSHSPDKEPYARSIHQISDRAFRVLPSQESGSSDQSANKWFSHANKIGVPGQRQSAELDDEPPFYVSGRANYVPTTFAASDTRHFGGVSRLDSENEDLRGVIDDLTVENKRLRQMIRSRQRQRRSTPSDANQQQDKLFEVRMHGVPPEKRRELEYLLKNFATSVHSNSGTPSLVHSISTASNLQSPSNTKSAAARTDSGYVSASGTPSVPTSNAASLDPVHKMASTRKAVNTYLQDIPDSLLPKQGPVMTERAKQLLVVRRLEQLFLGRVAGPGNHDQPMQQQEVSHSAAQADRLQDAQDNKKRRIEGRREAHVMAPDTKVNLDTIDTSDSAESSPPRKETSTPGSPDQRPTRPLDLDIHRAQLANDSIQYIQHLGLSTPYLGDAEAGKEGPWMFLALLTGLAQLHTLNVTPDFVRHAIRRFSKRFELSKDGLKVRWTGGRHGTSFAVDDERLIEAADIVPQSPGDIAGMGGSSKHSKTNSTSNAAVTPDARSVDNSNGPWMGTLSKQQQLLSGDTLRNQICTNSAKPTSSPSAFDYKPIILRQTQIEYDELRDSDESLEISSGDSSGLVHALSKSRLSQRAKDEGHITFYNNPHFCSDFSSELDSSNMRQTRHVVAGEVLGMPEIDYPESPLRYHDATYFTTQFAPKPFDVEKLGAEQMARLDASLLRLVALAPISEAGESETVPLEFDVCGLGGIMPDDNFALDVKLNMRAAPTRGPDMIVKQLPFSRRKYLHKFSTKIESCKKIDLLPSKLPPPSYIFFTSSSSSDAIDMADDSDPDDSSQGSSSPFVDETCLAPLPFLRQFSGDSRVNQADNEDNDIESEIDLLASAREVNPGQVAEQERLYMLNQSTDVQRAVASSLAPTVGETESVNRTHDGGIASCSVTGDGSKEESEEDEDSDMDAA